MAITRSQMNRLLRDLHGPARRAIENVIRAAQGRVNVTAMVKAIEAGDIDAVLHAAGIREGMWSPLTEELRSVFSKSGAAILAADVPKRFGAQFDLNNPRAEAWLRNKSSQLITGNLKPQQRAAVQEILQSGMARGANPRTTALDIVGRISKETGRRTGGVLGLTQQQAGYVVNASDDLLELNPRYFSRKLRDRRFDPLVRKSIKDGKPLDQATRNRIIGRYEDRMLKHRADTIARTETLASLNEASDEALRQVIDEGLAPRNAVTRVWRHSFSPNERAGHLAMNGQERGVDEFFNNPITGAVLKHPGDGGASETVNCFSGDTVLSYDSCKKSIRSIYDGELITLKTARGHQLTGTPNHPVMTDAGLVRLDQVEHGTKLVCCDVEKNLADGLDVDNVPTTFQKLHDTLSIVGVCMRVIGVPVNLYGRVPNRQIDVVRPKRLLRHGVIPSRLNQPHKFFLKVSDFGQAFLFSQRLFFGRLYKKTSRLFSDSFMSVAHLASPLRLCHCGPFQSFSFGLISDVHTGFDQPAPYSAPVDVEALSNSVLRFSRHVHFDNPVSIKREFVHNHSVYTVETKEGFYNAGGIIASNCRCYVEHRIDFVAVEEARAA